MTETNITPIKPPIVVLYEKLENRKGELKKALTDIDPDHFIRALINAAHDQSGLAGMQFQFTLECLHGDCQDNLLPNGVEGAIVPYKDKATWIPMYRGLLKRFRQSGECKWITANVVRQGEVFEHWIDQTGEHFKHVPDISDGVAPVELVYTAALTKDGAFYVAVMTLAEINKIKAESRASRENSPWRKWGDEMMKKTALRRLSKLLPAGRDFFEDDESPEPLAPPPLPITERNPGAAAALISLLAERQALPAMGSRAAAQSRLPPNSTNPLSIAYERGRIARETGAQRRAVPGEYREDNAAAELEAWLAGYDGKDSGNAEGAA